MSLLPAQIPGPRPLFPIPMRGNELLIGMALMLSGCGFPIPMRGNELKGEKSGMSANDVSNPHEG